MTEQQKAAIEVAATKAWEADARHNPSPNNPHAYMYGFKQGANEVIERPERYGLVPAAHTAALQERVKELEAENERYREALERAYNDFKSSRWTEETYKIVIEALLKRN